MNKSIRTCIEFIRIKQLLIQFSIEITLWKFKLFRKYTIRKSTMQSYECWLRYNDSQNIKNQEHYALAHSPTLLTPTSTYLNVQFSFSHMFNFLEYY
jgi:hypothetical protein